MAAAGLKDEVTNFGYKLWECFLDPCVCCFVCVVPCGICFAQAGAVGHAYGEFFQPYWCIYFFCCIGATINRYKIRKGYKIDGNIIFDFLQHFF